jgi:hypothetical protein
MCRSSREPGGPRRCPSHGRAKIRETVAQISALEERQAGLARYLGPATGVRDGDRLVDWTGTAVLYQLEPPLNGYGTVVASTVDRVPAVKSRGTQWNVETFLFGVGEDSQVDWDELPGSAWGATSVEALHGAGYRPAVVEEQTG